MKAKTTPPTIFELCDSVPSGHWTAAHFIDHFDTKKPVSAVHCEWRNEKDQRCSTFVADCFAREPTAEYFARLSPDVVRKVAQALGYAREVILPTIRFTQGSIHEGELPEPVNKQSEEAAMCISHIDRALRLLNGLGEEDGK